MTFKNLIATKNSRLYRRDRNGAGDNMRDIQKKYKCKVALSHGLDGVHEVYFENEKKVGEYIFVQYHHINPYKPYWEKAPERMAIFKEDEKGQLECVRQGVYVGDLNHIEIIDGKIHIKSVDCDGLWIPRKEVQIVDPNKKEERYLAML
jgi:hypothetical protein